MKTDLEIKKVLLQLLSKSTYNEQDRLLVCETFGLHLESTTIFVNSDEQRKVIADFLKKE